jgi:hypothetical protein
MPFFQKKLTLSGDVLELKTYSRFIQYDTHLTQKRFYKPKPKSQIPTFRVANAFRTRRNLRLLVLANSLPNQIPNFITLTFKDPIEKIKTANYHVNKFIHRLNYQTKTALKYVAVPEIQYARKQKFGHSVWHYHILAFNLPPLPHVSSPELPSIPNLHPWLSSLWSNGFVFLKPVFNDILHAANYVAKYLTKNHWESKLYGKKKFFSSKNLNRPITNRQDDLTNIILENYITQLPDYDKTKKIDIFNLEVQTQVYKLTKQQKNIINSLLNF